LEFFKERGREKGIDTILDADTMVQVAMAELLMQIFCVWSKTHSTATGCECITLLRFVLLFSIFVIFVVDTF